MGEIRIVTCKKCDRSWQYKTGCGLMHGRIAYAIQSFPEQIGQKIQADAVSDSPVLFDFAYRPASCRNCKKVVSVPALTLEDAGKRYIAPCPECGGAVDVEVPLVCPVCGNDALDEKKLGEWD